MHLTDSASSGGGSNGSATLSVSVPATIGVVTGQSRNITVTLTRQGFDKPLTLRAYGACSGSVSSCQPLPAGVTATFSPGSLSGTVLTSTLTLAVAPDAKTASVPVLIDANNGDFDAVTSFNVNIVLPSLTVTRDGTGTGTVTSSPAGLNCGGACTGQFAMGANVTLTATATAGNAFAGWSGGCTGTSATCNLTISAPSTNVTATFNSTVPAFSMGISPATDTVPQGGSRTARVSITRVNGFTGAVNLAVSGAPAGLTVTPNPASVTGDSSALTIAVPLSVAAGNYPLTLTGTGTGVAQHTATFNVLVTPVAGGSSNVALSFATCDPTQVPIWFAVQNGSGPWAAVPAGTNGTFSFPVTAVTGIAYVQRSGTSYSTTVLYGSGSELTSVASGDPCRIEPQVGANRVNLTVSRLAVPPIFARISIGGADTTYLATSGPNLTLVGVPSGPRDLIAGVHGATGSNGFTPLQRLLIRRNVNAGNSATLSTLDMFGPETFVPALHRDSVNNLGADQQSLSESFITANGVSSPLYEDGGVTGQAVPGGVFFYAVPDSLLQPNDLHAIQVAAAPPGNNPAALRFMFLLLHSPGNRSVTLGPALASPTVASAAAAPYLRPRAQVQAQSEYNGAASAQFGQSANSVDISATAGYFGGTPATWTLEVPDLTSAGYNAAWGLQSGLPVDWQVSAFAGNILALAGATPVDGNQILGASRSSASSASIGSRPAGPMQWLRRR